MKLRLPHKFQAALMAALASVSFTTLSTGSTAQAADTILANVMNTGGNTAVTTDVWGDTGVISSASASYSITAGSGNPTATDYTNSFLATRTNVGSGTPGGSYTYTLTFKTAESLANPVSLSSINVDFITFNGSGQGHNQGAPDYNKINCTWTLTETTGGTLQNVSLPDNGFATKTSAAYTHNTDDTYTTNNFSGATTNIDFTDFALKDDTTYTLTLAVSKAGGANGFFVGIGNISFLYTPETFDYTWAATTAGTDWMEANAWTKNGEDATFTANGNATFGATGTTAVGVSSAVVANNVTVSGQNYTFNLTGSNASLTANALTVESGLSITGTGTVTAGGISFGNGSTVNLAAESVLDLSGITLNNTLFGNVAGHVAGAGTVKLGSAQEIAFAGNQTTNLSANVDIAAGIKFNGHGYDSDGHTLNLGNGTDTIGGVKVNGDLGLESEMLVNVNAGSTLTVTGTLYMGHSQAGNPGFLNVNGGTLRVGHIQFRDDTTENTITLTDATVEATQAGNLFANNGNSSTVSATNVTLKSTGVDWAWNRAMAFGGTLTVDAGTNTITLGAAGANFSVGKAIELTSGTVAFAGNWNLSDIPHTGTISYTGGKVEGTNGFASLATELQLVNVGTGTAIGSTSGAHFTIDGVTATLDANGLAKTSGNVDYDTFHVITGSENVSQGRADGHNPVYSLADNTTLVVDADLTNAQLTRESGATGTATLTGANTITLSNTGSLGTGIVLHSTGWTGKVKVTGTVNDLNMTGLGTASSTIVLDGWTGYFNGSPTIASDVEIGSGGAHISDGSSSNTITFAGTLTGSGDIERTNDGSPTINLKFTGDVSGYTGNIIHNRCLNTNPFNITFDGSANVINAAALKNGETAAGNLNITFAAANTVVNSVITRNTTNQWQQNQVNVTVNANTTFNETVTADKVEIGNGASATFNKAVSLKGDLTMNGTDAAQSSVRLNEDSSVSVIDLSHGGNAHGTVTVATGKALTYGSSFWGANNNRLILEEGATVQKTSDAPVTIKGLEGGGYVSSSANDLLELGKSMFTLHNVEATINTASDNVQLHFDNSKFVTSHNVTLKNLQSVFSGMDIQGGTTTVGAGVAADTTVQLGEVTLSGGNLTLAEHVIGSVNGIDVTDSGTVTGGKLVMGDIITMGADATLTLSDNMVVDVSALTPEPGSRTDYVDGDNAGNGFASMVASVRLVDFTDGGTVAPGTGVTYVSGSNHGTLVLDGDNKGLVEFNETSYSALYVNTPNTTEMMVNAQEKAISKGAVLTEVYLNAGTLDTTDAEMLFGTLHVNSGEGTVYVTGDTASITSLDGKGTLSVDPGTNLNGTNLNIAAGDTLTLTGGATITYNNISNQGTLGIGENTRLSTGAITVSGDTFTTTGAGTLVSSGKLTVDGGTVNLGSNAQFSAIDLGNGTLDITAGTTTVSGTVTLGYGNGKASGTLNVAQGATLTAQNVSSPWGYSSMTVAGTINATGQFAITTGAQVRNVSGSGTINTGRLVVGNVTTKAVFSGGLEINIGDGGITGSNGVRPLELHDVTVGVYGDSTGWSAENAITLADTTTGTTFNIGAGKAVTLNGAISGSGKLVKDGAGILELTGVSSFGGAFTVNDGKLLITTNGLPGTLTASGVGELDLRVNQGGQDVDLKTVSAANLHLVADSTHNSRFNYKNNTSNLNGVEHLYFDGGQLWLNGKDMTDDNKFTGNVTFNTTTYSENNAFGGAAIRVGNNATFTGNVDVHANTKLTWGGDKTVEFAGNVTGSGNLELKRYSGTGTFKVSGDATGYTGAITSDSLITLNVANGGQLALATGSNLAGAVALDGTMTVTGNATISGAVSGAGSLIVDSGATLTLGGAGLISVGSLTMSSGSYLDVSNIAQMAGITVNLASYTNSVAFTQANITGVNSSLNYTLNTEGGHVTLTFASAPSPTPFTPVVDLGKVMYVGDSITDGVTGQKSWRYSFFQVLADGGISQTEEGYFQHRQSSGAITETTYGGRDFENNHSAQASARSWETAGVPTSEKGGDRYGYSSIQNWLGQSETLRNGNAYTGAVYEGENAPDTYFMLLGTNDLLSEGGNHVTEQHFNNVLASMFGYSNGTFDGETGTFDKIWKSMTDARTDSKLVVLEMPTWSPNHSNHQDASDFAYMTKFNQKLHEWVNSQENKGNITVVNPNPGIVDVANTSKPGAGVPTMYVDNLHPNAQGELIIAGNIAKQLGYAGRTVGLDRANSTTPDTVWTAASEATITVTAGAEALTFAENAFSTGDGYTIDFGAVYGNGAVGGWSDKANALTVQVGDGYNTGTLTFSEAYVMWGGTILYSRDNSQAGDNFRIAYINQSINEEDHVSTGYYVWMGDQLIGEALGGVSGSFNGIQLTSTGANGTVTDLTWSNTAYAPTTTLYENPDSEARFHLVQDNVLPTHDSKVAKSLQIDFTDATENDAQFGTTGQAATGDLLLRRTGTHTQSWFGPVGAAHEGNVSMLYDNLQATTNIFGAINGSVTNGNVSVVLDNGTHIGAGTYDGTGNCSIIGTYQQSIGGDFRVEINNATLDGSIIMGVGNGNGKTVANTLLYINSGASIGGDVFGGNYSRTSNNTITGDATIYITGGTVNGSVYGGNKSNGTIGGNTNITITGGVITGDVNGGGTGGTVTGSTNVTVEGILPYIKGNINAQNVTLKDVVNAEGYTDGFDSYKGTITATTLTLDNYQANEMLATVTAANLALTNGTATTINKLTTTSGTAITVDATSSLTLGQANLSAAISNAGTLVLTQDITATGLVQESSKSYYVGVDDTETDSDNHFLDQRTEGTIRVVSGGGTLTPGGHKVTQGGVDYALSTDGTATGVTAEADFSVFLQEEGGSTLDYSAIEATAARHGKENELVVWTAGATLNIDREGAFAMLENATANIAQGLEFQGGLGVMGGMNYITGQIDTARVSFATNANSETVFTDAPVQADGVRFTSDAGKGGVVVDAAKVSDEMQVTRYSVDDGRFDVQASELAKVDAGDVSVAHNVTVERVHNSAENATGKLTLEAGVAAAALKEVVATSGDIEFLNMGDAVLRELEIGEGKAVSMYTGNVAEVAQEASVTVTGTLKAGEGAQLNAGLNMASGSHLDVSGAQGSMGLIMGSPVTLNSGMFLDIEGYAQDEVSGYLYNYLSSGEHDLYYLYIGQAGDPIELTINGVLQQADLDKRSWNDYDMDANTIYANLQAQTFYVRYDGSNVGMVAIGLIPEPTTGTLSLLALCALAARRRRK